MTTLTRTLRNGAIALAVTAGLATAFVAVAHPESPGSGHGPGPGMMGHGGPGMMMGLGHGPMFGGNHQDVAKFQQEHLGQLKSQLGITPEQQAAWDAFAAKAAEQAKTMQAMHQSADAATMPERMKQHQQAMGERQQAMESMRETVTRLYDVLTPQQKEIFDRSGGPMHRHG